MPRNIDSALLAACQSGNIAIAFLADIQFKSSLQHICTAPFPITWNEHTYTGTGTFGQLSSIKETLELQAQGISLTLSGVDTAILQDCLSDIQVGAPATVYFGALATNAVLIGQPMVYYSGFVDAPTHTSGPDRCSITLPIESRLLRLQSGGQQRRYTSADQRITAPNDTIFQFVERDNDLALRFGQS